jgi:hypothetical protein
MSHAVAVPLPQVIGGTNLVPCIIAFRRTAHGTTFLTQWNNLNLKRIGPQKEISHFCTVISHSASQAQGNAQKCSPGSGPPDLQTIWVPAEG